MHGRIVPTGLTRNVYDRHRISVPIDMYEDLDLVEGETMEVYAEIDEAGNLMGILYRPLDRGCIFCGRKELLKTLRGKRICKKCREAITKSETKKGEINND